MRAAAGPGRRAFTLIEVTLGLAILVLIFGVMFQLVQMSVLGAEAAGKNSQRTREVSGLFALVRQLCLDVPVRAQLILETRGRTPGYDLVFSNAPLVILPERKDGSRILRLALKKDPLAGGHVLRLEEVFQPTNSFNRPEPPQTNAFELMRDVVSLGWSVFDPRDRQEKTEWVDPVKPAYLKLELVRRSAGQNQTSTGIFWIPAGYGPAGQPPVDPVSRYPLTLTNPTNSRGG